VSRNRWLVIVLLMGYAAIGHFNRVGISVAGDEMFIPVLKIPETRMGWVYTAFLILYTIGMLPGGWLIDRIGSARALALYGVTMGSFVILTGALGWLTTNPYGLFVGLLVIRGLAGICNAPLHPGAANVVAEVMPPGRRATANGMVTAGALIGIACCYPAFGWLMDTLSWQWAFVAGGSMLFAYGVLWHLVATPLLNTPVEVVESREMDPQPPASEARVSLRTLMSNNTLWLLTLSYAAYGYFQYLFFYWLGYYFKEILEIPPVRARWATTWIMLTMGVGMAVGGRLTDVACNWLGTVRGRRTIVITGMGLGAVFGLAGVNSTFIVSRLAALGIEAETFVCISVCLALSMAAVGMCEGVFWTTATDIGGRSGGLAGAFMNTGGNIGGLISPVLTPFIALSYGWPVAIGLACVISAVGGLTWMLITPPTTDTTDTTPV
jgi:ACS family D-galactonate transporter-like MFS transporter